MSLAKRVQSPEPLRYQGNTIDWEVTHNGTLLTAEGFYRDKRVAVIRSRRPWVLALRISLSHVWHLAVSR